VANEISITDMDDHVALAFRVRFRKRSISLIFQEHWSGPIRVRRQWHWIYPANTAQGEAERMTWLKGYISENQICPFGYTIVERKSRAIEGSAKASIIDQLTRSIRYVGRCKSAP
jgi:hypothetical protein